MNSIQFGILPCISILFIGTLPIHFSAIEARSISFAMTNKPESGQNQLAVPMGGEDETGEQRGFKDPKEVWSWDKQKDTQVIENNQTTEACGGNKEASYVLPYPVGREYYCIQCGGDGEKFTHFGLDQYAVDFLMKMGSKVTAARGGQVKYVRDSSRDDDHRIGMENFIIVLHADGTYGRYMHLQKGGAKVKAGQILQQGDLLGLSGNSGFSTDPHLHFDVTKDCWAGACETLPLCFKNTNSSEVGLVTGNFYLADN